ncbi:MAG: YeiH family protein [Marinifilaceae bacterium]
MREFILSLIKKEDYWSIWIGSFILIFMTSVAFKAIPALQAKYNEVDQQYVELRQSGSPEEIAAFNIEKEKAKIKAPQSAIAKEISTLVKRPGTWEYNPIVSVYNPEKGVNLFPSLFMLFAFSALLFGLGAKAMGVRYRKFIIAFGGIFVLAVIAYIMGGQISAKHFGINYAIWAIAIGIIISNTIGVPNWMKPALMGEFYIKTGLILLGAEILFSKVLEIGIPGIFVTWVVTPIVLVGTFIFGQKVLQISSKSLNMTICADMSVCGVSAAIATAMACKAKKEELTLAISLSMVFTAIMMVVMPIVIKACGLPEVLGGAWLGGTLDATGAVVAAGAFLGEKALSVAATIKMIQNILIGFVAFGVAVYWTTKVEKNTDANARPRLTEIWTRFPKFLLGFIGASIIFSLMYSYFGDNMGNQIIENGVIKGFTKNYKDWLFCFAFVAIGLNTNFKVLGEHFKSGKHITLYLCGQLFNIVLTLVMAYIMFYIVFPEITAAI